MEKHYQPEHLERRWYAHWEQQGCFAPAGKGKPYCIMLPPPNVTGQLHMGHAFQNTLMDLLIRRQRMDGGRALWQGGVDHAGIATQLVVEHQLRAQGQEPRTMEREELLRAAWDWRTASGDAITRQMRRLGASLDWSRERFTLDEGMSSAVLEVFLALHREGLIYRGQRLVNWDPSLCTAVSDLEVSAREEDGRLWHLRYPVVGTSTTLVVATTRPETLLGDTALAVHPEDERYRRWIGGRARVPLCDREIPIIADDFVDPQFGSGCVKVTPAHDFNDYEVGLRHKLPCLNIFTPEARLNEQAPPAFRGLQRGRAREAVLQALRAQGLLEKVEPHRFKVPRCERTREIVEPLLTRQWFVRTGPLAEPAIRAVEQGRVRFIPESWNATYFEWLRNIQDWCISRQLWWGHRIPAWYTRDGDVHVGRSEEELRQRAGLSPETELRRDPDVLDTWFSSALWPFSTLGWPQQTGELRSFYPTSVLVTGFDIIFFWVARMIMLGLKFTGEVPFREVYIHGLVLDSTGQKMSKSKGNVLDPLDLVDGVQLEPLVKKRTQALLRPGDAPRIESSTRREFPEGIPAYGADALRLTFTSLASLGRRELRFEVGRIKGNRHFCNKLWNATRYVLGAVSGQGGGNPGGKPRNAAEAPPPGTNEAWILARLGRALGAINSALDEYRFDQAARVLRHFAWEEYCDWYLELAKISLGDARRGAAEKAAVRRTLLEVLEAFLRLAHPFIPFLSEELWRRVQEARGAKPEPGASLMLQPWPRAEQFPRAPGAEAEIQWLQDFLGALRQMRSENRLAPGRLLPLYWSGGTARERTWLHHQEHAILALGRLRGLEESPRRGDAATALVGDMLLQLPLEGLVDPNDELRRLRRELEKLDKRLRSSEQRLANQDFLERAPPELVQREQQRHVELSQAMDKLQYEQLRLQDQPGDAKPSS